MEKTISLNLTHEEYAIIRIALDSRIDILSKNINESLECDFIGREELREDIISDFQHRINKINSLKNKLIKEMY